MLVVLEAKSKTRYYISLRFTVTQHWGGTPPPKGSPGQRAGDLVLLNGLINYLGCGRCFLSRNDATFIPSGENYPIYLIKLYLYLTNIL